MRPPTQQELEGLIEDYIQEEIYYREAVTLGLDQDNSVIRRHLRQKMEFLSEDIAAQANPSEEDLQAFLSENPERFRQDAALSFRQIYFSHDKRGDMTAADATSLLAQLDGTESKTETAEMGDALPLPHAFKLTFERDVTSRFGKGFVDHLLELDTGRWLGPVQSGFGLHLVYVDERIDAEIPELEAIRDVVAREWREERRQEVNAAFYEGLRGRYSVVIERPNWLNAELNIENVEQRQ